MGLQQAGVDLLQGDVAVEGEAAPAEDATPSGEHAPLIERMQAALADRASAVRVTTRLTESPACLVSSRDGLSTNLERLMKAAGQAMPEAPTDGEAGPANTADWPADPPSQTDD